MSLKPLNTATCTKCNSKNTARGGFVLEKKASLWKCRDCGNEFQVATLFLKKVEDPPS